MWHSGRSGQLTCGQSEIECPSRCCFFLFFSCKNVFSMSLNLLLLLGIHMYIKGTSLIYILNDFYVGFLAFSFFWGGGGVGWGGSVVRRRVCNTGGGVKLY